MSYTVLKNAGEVRRALYLGDVVYWRHSGHRKRRRLIFAKILSVTITTDSKAIYYDAFVTSLYGREYTTKIDHAVDQVCTL